MIRKVVIAAAGQGTRMLHLTKNKSKHLIRLQKRPFLAYLLDNILGAGYKEIILVVGYREDLMKQFLEEYQPKPKVKKSSYKIITVNQHKILGPKEKEYGTACPIKCVKKLTGKEKFLFLCGDNLYSTQDLKAMNIGDRYNYIAGMCREHPEKYGVLVTDNGYLKKIVEKPQKFIGNFTNVGLYKFTPEIFDKVYKIKKSPRGEYEVTDAINLLAKEKKVKIKKIKKYWLDFGNPADIIRISQFLKNEG